MENIVPNVQTVPENLTDALKQIAELESDRAKLRSLVIRFIGMSEPEELKKRRVELNRRSEFMHKNYPTEWETSASKRDLDAADLLLETSRA